MAVKQKHDKEEEEIEEKIVNQNVTAEEEQLKGRIKSALVNSKRKSLSITASSRACSIQ